MPHDWEKLLCTAKTSPHAFGVPIGAGPFWQFEASRGRYLQALHGRDLTLPASSKASGFIQPKKSS
jgi:hypothetical protein